MIRRIFTLWIAAYFLCAAASTSATARQTQQWIDILNSDASLFEKARACQLLGESGTKEAVPALAALVNDDVLSAYARAGLERIPGPEAPAALRDALNRTQGKLRVGVINSLAALRDEQAVTALGASIQDSDPNVVKAALLALGRISSDQALPVIRQALIEGPEAFRPDAAAACLLAAQNLFNEGKADTAQSIFDAVREARVPASYRVGATRGAIVARQADRVAFFMQQLQSDEPAIRDVALLTVRAVPSNALANALNAELEDAPRDLQIQLLAALKDCRNAQSLPVIRNKAQSNDAEIRLAALRLLAVINDPDSASIFLNVMTAGPDAEELLIAIDYLERTDSTEVNEQILKALQSTRASETRVQLIRLLDTRHVTEATDILLEQAASSDRNAQIAAFQALKSLADFDTLPHLIAMTKECRDDSVRDAAVNALCGICKDNEHVAQLGDIVLEELETSTTTAERESWIRVLTSLGYAQGLPAITAMLDTGDQELVQSTITQLSRWPDPAPMEALLRIVESPASPSLRRQALRAVLQLATAAADRKTATDESLMGWFRRAHEAVQSVQEKRLLISGLGRVKHIDSIRLSASYLDDSDVRTEAAYAIVNAAQPLVKGPDRKTVEDVLRKISGIQDQRLLEQITKLQHDMASTTAEPNEP